MESRLTFALATTGSLVAALTGILLMAIHGFDGDVAGVGVLVFAVGSGAFLFTRWLRREFGLGNKR